VAKKIIVVGGGIVGCITALKLAERGCQVTVVERNQIAAQTSGESSWAGAGILFPLLPWMYKEEVNSLALSGASLYPALCQRLLDETGIDPEYTQSGMLIMPPFDAALSLDWCEKNQIETQQIDRNLLLPKVAQVRNPRLMQALKQCLIQQNVTLLERTQLEPLQQTEKITGWKANTGAVLEADAFVVTSGAWSFELLKDTVANLNIKPMRGQILLYQLPQNSLKNIIDRKSVV
jgi:glycine oxidase